MAEAELSGAAATRRPRVVTFTLTPAFKLVFLSVLGITLLSIVLSCSLAVMGEPNEEKSALVQALLTTWKLGFGAIIGLLGGKAF